MTWKFPFVARERIEEIRAEKNIVIEIQKKRIEDLERETRRLHDMVYKNNFGFQVFDTIPADAAPAKVETPPEEQHVEIPPDVFEEAKREARQRLAHIRHTNPSKLGPAIAQEMRRETAMRAQAANPAKSVFAAAKEAALQ